jgi:hypothetical protein
MLLWITAGSVAQAADLKDFYPNLPSEAESNVRAFLYGSRFNAPAQLLSSFRSAGALSTFNTEIADFNYDPLDSTVPTLTSKFASNISIFKRSIDSLRPLVSKLGQTTADGKPNSALDYSWIHYDQFQGQRLDNYTLTRDSAPVIAVTPTTANVIFGPLPSEEFGSFRHFRPRLTAADVPAVQRDHWIPMRRDSGDLHARCGDLKHHVRRTCGALPRDLPPRQRPGAGSHRLGHWASFQTSDSEQSGGIGGLVLRTKTDFFHGDYGALASRLDFDVPSGDAANLQGLGQPAARASLTYSAAFGDFSPHASVGFLWRFDTQQFNAMRFVLGGDVRIGPWLTATTDVLINQDTAQFNVGKTVLSVATGIKVESWRRAVLSTSLVWRLNDQGLGGLFVPSVAIVYTLR